MIRRLFQPPKHDRWDDYFDPGETLLWQGAPEPGPRSYLLTIFLSIFGVPFLLAGLGSAGTGLASLIGMEGIADLGFGVFLLAFSVPFIAAGGGLAIGTWYFAFNEHKFTRYALTNKRAYIAKSFFKHAITSYKLQADDVITLEQGRFDSVKFKTVHGYDSDGDKTANTIGFDWIKDGRDVYAMIRQIQQEATHDN